VRTEARRLRVRLGEYYANSGKHDAVVIELPKGGYVPKVCAAPAEADRLKATPRLLSPKLGIGLLVLTLGILGWARLGPGGRPRSNPNAEASGLYLRARAFEALPGLRGIEDSIDLFQQALARDPAFAPAYAGIAAGQAARSAFDRFTVAERADIIAKGWAAAHEALLLGTQLADAHDALGMMQARQAQWEQAERSFRRAIELAPRDPLWRNHFALFLLLPLGRVDEEIGRAHV